jgi:hypothetical protein
MSRKVEMVRHAPDESFTTAVARERTADEVFGKATKFQKVDKATVEKALGALLDLLYDSAAFTILLNGGSPSLQKVKPQSSCQRLSFRKTRRCMEQV